VIVAALIAVTIPLTAVTIRVRDTTTTEATVSDLADSWAAAQGWTIVSVDTQASGVVVRAIGPLPEPDTGPLQASIAGAGLGETQVAVELVPSHTVTFGGDGS
jgi:hypothetical protein